MLQYLVSIEQPCLHGGIGKRRRDTGQHLAIGKHIILKTSVESAKSRA
jgi:hypothetical protein